MKIELIAIWTRELEVLKDFYVNYLGGQPGPIYHNEKKNFKSYLMSFGSGARLEVTASAN